MRIYCFLLVKYSPKVIWFRLEVQFDFELEHMNWRKVIEKLLDWDLTLKSQKITYLSNRIISTESIPIKHLDIKHSLGYFFIRIV